ncbi:MAG: NADH-quinone oxidoreductase subunit NuoG [Gammaproteobacteria bacterium]|nr:NADH-quinone oxidoreductase subunit NuoG [Gammaproteobacteria bacterium]
MIEFELDGKPLSVPEGTTIIEAADEAGVYIPRFCYHKKLSIAANCRMCLIEVEKMGKPLPACATPITQDMKVSTKSPMAIKAQRDVMEFLLINHPLDCPICDQGGECELQDLSMGFGQSKSEYTESKRAVCSQDIGPLIETEMTRCIQCTRCVRFGEEVAGLREMGVVNRGEKEEIGTYVQHFLKSEVSGNIIDLCPVGALTNKPARYQMRGWEVKEHASISPHDCVGTNVFLHSRAKDNSPERHVFRSVPKENQAINEMWMSDRDRFSVEGLYHKDRVYKPLMKKNDKWVEVEWAYALDAIAHLTLHIKNTEAGAEALAQSSIAGIAGYSSTTEEYYLFQKLIRSLGSNNIDHRIRESDFTDQMHRPLFPALNSKIADIEECDTILLVGSNVRYEQPIISTRIFKAYQDGLKVMAVNPEDYSFVYKLSEKMIAVDIVNSLAEIAKALEWQKDFDSANGSDRAGGLEHITPSDNAKKIAQQLLSSKKAMIVFGAYALHHPHAATLRALVHHIKVLSGATTGSLTDGANTAGAWIAGCVPHRDVGGAPLIHTGKEVKSLLTTDPASAYFILDTELEFDSAYKEKALETLSQAKLVVCLSTFATEKMREYADFILPITPYAENEGTYVNVQGDWQSFKAAGVPHGESKPAWKVLRVLANKMNLPEFNYETVNEIRDALLNSTEAGAEALARTRDALPESNTEAHTQIILPKFSPNTNIPTWHIYQDNALVRRANALQETINPFSKGGEHE